MNKWTIIIEDLAQLDLQETYEWYEKQKAGLGEIFLDFLDEAIERIKSNPLHASLYDNEFRSLTLKKFPYGIIYLTDEIRSSVFVIAITHLHRQPSWFRNRK